MSYETSLIATLALSLIAALLGALVAARLRLPSLVGYLLAGVLIGPFTSRLVADAHLAQEVAEVGVIQLMFGVGLHFSVRELLMARTLAIPGAILQMAWATCLGAALAFCWGWSPGGRAGVWDCAFGGKHSSAAAGTSDAGCPQPGSRSHRGSLADRRGPIDGAGYGVASGLCQRPWRASARPRQCATKPAHQQHPRHRGADAR
jgi:sodium/hydrogen exchanger family protein